MLHADCAGVLDKLVRRDSSIRPIFRVPRRSNDGAACLCLVDRMQELGVQRQQLANVSVVRDPLRVRGDVLAGVGVVGADALERADRPWHGSRRGGHGGTMHA